VLKQSGADADVHDYGSRPHLPPSASAGLHLQAEGATFQHEDLRLDLSAITHLSLVIVPNKGGSGVATLTSVHTENSVRQQIRLCA
jgi:hypothetical protein